jgi:V/A-type H+-transporting ATPase subunit D
MQLEMEKQKIVREIEALSEKMKEFHNEVSKWQKLFCEAFPKVVHDFVHVRQVVTGELNIAGILMPLFKDVVFEIEKYDLVLTPVWFDLGVETVQKIMRFREHSKILHTQQETISVELRRTTQRINLFKERLIPECRENIRQIRIYLGDVQAAAVGRAKIAKQKMQKQYQP